MKENERKMEGVKEGKEGMREVNLRRGRGGRRWSRRLVVLAGTSDVLIERFPKCLDNDVRVKRFLCIYCVGLAKETLLQLRLGAGSERGQSKTLGQIIQ